MDPSEAEVTEVPASGQRTDIPFPSGVVGAADVYAQATNQPDSDDFAVVDQQGQPVGPIAEADLAFEVGPPGDRYRQVASVDVPADAGYMLLVGPQWAGRVSFVPDDDPPLQNDWRMIIAAVALLSAGGIVATIGTIRRLRWRKAITTYKTEMTAQGHEVG